MELYQSFYRELVLANRTFESQLNGILQQQGIHRSDWSVLYYLIHEEDLTSVEIAKRLNIEKPNVTRTIKNLVNGGYVTVETSKEDKRKKRIIVTAEGLAMYEEVRVYVDEFERSTMEGVSIGQQQILLETFQQIQENLQKRAGTKSE